MPAVPKTLISEDTYLEEERNAETKSEYYKGEIFAMAGASKEHNSIVIALSAATYNFLKGKKCKTYPSDLRVHNTANSLYTYPDLSVVCGKEEFLDNKFDTLLNPTVIFEVLSPSTENYDRGTKFKLYRSIASLQNYVMISSTEYLAEVYTRSGDTWVLTTAKGKEETLYINSIDYKLELTDVYAQVDELENERK